MPALTEQQSLYQSEQHFNRPTANLKAPSPHHILGADGRLCQGRLSQYNSANFYTFPYVCAFQYLIHLLFYYFSG